MNIIFLTYFPFPHGLAPVNRLIAICKGLIEEGHDVKIFCLFPTEIEKNSQNFSAKGVYSGIHYEYIGRKTIIPKQKIIRFWTKIYSHTRSLVLLYKFHKTKRIDAIIHPYPVTIFLFGFYLFSKLSKIPLIHEKNEYPNIHEGKGLKAKFDLIVYERIYLSVFDGLYVATIKLYDYFKNKVKKNCKIEVIPMLVEPEPFTSSIAKNIFEFEYIAYCGNMGLNSLGESKDGVEILINAFSLISKKYPKIRLCLIGDAEKEEFNRLKSLVISSGLESKVIFTNKIVREKMPVYLSNAKVLVLARPDNEQARGGFPTKLGEYLSTGRPVVVTSVGEIPMYLIDGKHAFLSKPNDSVAFAQKMDFVLSNPQVADIVGNEGKTLVYGVFNYRVNASKLVTFINSLSIGELSV